MISPGCISNVALPVAPKSPLRRLAPSTSPGDFGLLRIPRAASQLVLCSSDSRRSFCSRNKKVCREGNSQTALLGHKLTLHLCAGPWKWEPVTRVLLCWAVSSPPRQLCSPERLQHRCGQGLALRLVCISHLPARLRPAGRARAVLGISARPKGFILSCWLLSGLSS